MMGLPRSEVVVVVGGVEWEVYPAVRDEIERLRAVIEPANRAFTWLSLLSGIGASLPTDKAHGLNKTIRDLHAALEAVDGSVKRENEHG